jgi:hypothetical protein
MEKLTPYQRDVLKGLKDFHHRVWVEPTTLATNIAKQPRTLEKKLLELSTAGLVEEHLNAKGSKGFRLSKTGRETARQL